VRAVVPVEFSVSFERVDSIALAMSVRAELVLLPLSCSLAFFRVAITADSTLSLRTGRTAAEALEASSTDRVRFFSEEVLFLTSGSAGCGASAGLGSAAGRAAYGRTVTVSGSLAGIS